MHKKFLSKRFILPSKVPDSMGFVDDLSDGDGNKLRLEIKKPLGMGTLVREGDTSQNFLRNCFDSAHFQLLMEEGTVREVEADKLKTGRELVVGNDEVMMMQKQIKGT